LLFEQIVKRDLEGIVCKRKDSPYQVTEKRSPYWIEIKNSWSNQWEGREELLSLQIGASPTTTVFAQQQFRNLA